MGHFLPSMPQGHSGGHSVHWNFPKYEFQNAIAFQPDCFIEVTCDSSHKLTRIGSHVNKKKEKNIGKIQFNVLKKYSFNSFIPWSLLTIRHDYDFTVTIYFCVFVCIVKIHGIKHVSVLKVPQYILGVSFFRGWGGCGG